MFWAKEKLDNSAHNLTEARGFTKDQRINIGTLNVQNQNTKYRQAVAITSSLAVEESTIGRQVPNRKQRQ